MCGSARNVPGATGDKAKLAPFSINVIKTDRP
jgi:hypothetical protein